MSNTEETNGMQSIPRPEFNPSIMAIGVGGGGCNAINHMIEAELRGFEFIAISTDPQILVQSKSPKRFLIHEKERRGLDGGGDLLKAEKAAEDSVDELSKMIHDSDMVFIVSTLGGGTGTGAAPVVASIAKQAGALTIGIVTLPFTFEGTRRMQKAFNGINHLKQHVDTLIIFHDDWLHEVENQTSVIDAFKMVDHILFQGIKGISDLVTVPCLICLDFNDIRSILNEGGLAVMGYGKASGDDRAHRAARMAVSSFPMDFPLSDACNILVNITSGPDLALIEVSMAIDVIREIVLPKASLLFGAIIDPKMVDEFQVTIIAIGYTTMVHRESDQWFLDLDI
ncbi:MAG: cell division protein FtsZ [Anaerolineaceae bacterium]